MITTFTGKQFDVFAPEIELIRIEDIAHALAYTCRFGGHCKRFYSVAEHSMAVSRCCKSAEVELVGLMHDAAEAYMGDIPGPIKQHLPQFKEAEDRLLALIFSKYSVGQGHLGSVHSVKGIDTSMLWWEARFLLPNTDTLPRMAAEAPMIPAFMTPEFYTPQEAEREFLHCFYSLQHRLLCK